MATVGQVYYNILDNNSGTYISSGIDIFNNIVTAYNARQFNKLGIQAPPGTQVVMNSAKTIMVGRTGMYELDDNINITNLYFVRPRKYIKDEEASADALSRGTQGMMTANTSRETALAEFYKNNPNEPDQTTDPDAYKAYWDAYNSIQQNYIVAYQEALNLYNQGSNGIYVLPNSSNINAEENYQDLYNIIVDFIYE